MPINAWERVLQMDILPNELYRSILAKDIDEMEMLGLSSAMMRILPCVLLLVLVRQMSAVIHEGLDILQAEG